MHAHFCLYVNTQFYASERGKKKKKKKGFPATLKTDHSLAQRLLTYSQDDVNNCGSVWANIWQWPQIPDNTTPRPQQHDDFSFSAGMQVQTLTVANVKREKLHIIPKSVIE